MKHLRHRLLTFLSGLLVTISAAAADAALKASELAVVAARANRESLGLAKYYCRQRGVPESQIIEIDVPPGEVIDREAWRWSVRPEVRKWLEENDSRRTVRCLVTTWGIPLKVSRVKKEDADDRYLRYLTAERTARSGQLGRIASLLDGLGGGSEIGAALEALPDNDPSKAELTSLQSRLEGALQSAQARLRNLSPEDRRPQEAKLQQLATAAGGASVLLRGIGQQIQGLASKGEEASAALSEQFHLLRGRASAFNEIRLLMDQSAPDIDRAELTLRLLQQNGGMIECIEWLDEQIDVVKRGQTGASFDSELSLVLWPDGYELLRWQPNYLRTGRRTNALSEAYPTLMVSRIDGPNLETAKRLIDDAIAVEDDGGLVGKAYFDARGLAELKGPPLKPGSYPDYDRSLLVAAGGLSELENEAGEKRFDVTLNELPGLFMPGQCSEAALYCGWYSLGKYVDAFDFARGAVAYHMASAEAVTLKEIDSQCWCKKLLEDGVAATIGPVNEPYLLAFPRPNEFFALLVRGELSLVEVYYQTKPFNSWQMTLIGDPLYRPFRRPGS